MIYLEMSRDQKHGGGTWRFPNCVWAPTKKRDATSWPFWSKILRISHGDIVIHLRGKPPDACFVGYSTASGDAFITKSRPPDPAKWGFATQFCRANLTDYVDFDQKINLRDVFSTRRSELEAYYERNKTRESRRNIFYVKQAGRLQCLNGAYLSDIDDELFAILFGHEWRAPTSGVEAGLVSIDTDCKASVLPSRIGHTRFAIEIKRLYSNVCCFPGCSIADPRFLVASHIARWSDNEDLRGHLGNGLCFCVFHDKAFEVGAFTLDDQLNIVVNPREKKTIHQCIQELRSRDGEQIELGAVLPLQEALCEHQNRTGIIV
ncbi:MAG: hypothetical protein OXH83_07220 [Bryobacterales bacterium]|nr:hypothetical protein [Bryobacterales bacterium]